MFNIVYQFAVTIWNNCFVVGIFLYSLLPPQGGYCFRSEMYLRKDWDFSYFLQPYLKPLKRLFRGDLSLHGARLEIYKHVKRTEKHRANIFKIITMEIFIIIDLFYKISEILKNKIKCYIYFKTTHNNILIF